MNELINWISKVSGLTVNATSAARAFYNINITTEKDLIEYLSSDTEYKKRPKGLGEGNYKKLVNCAIDYAKKQELVFVGLACSYGVSFWGWISKQDYAEFTSVIEALRIWFSTHEVK